MTVFFSRRKKNLRKFKKRVYSNLSEAFTDLKMTATANFIESVELHANLNINPKAINQQYRTTVTLPHGIGKTIKLAVLTTTENFEETINAGADIVGNDDLIEKISNGQLKFDLLITTPNMMAKIAKLGRILGPKGLMPSPKSGTVTTELIKSIHDFKNGKVEYRTDKTGNIHVLFGKANFTEKQLIDNFYALYNSIEQNRPKDIKGKLFKNLFICTTMGPSLKLNLDIFS
uniref:Large ribosomal subunit protein uL1c n=1 Tax=Astrosyne radiata TaxID=1158023 RepID=A0A2U9NTT6_9STRA|nr:ribosomal protein L1 [Astrosyne radiata]AWT40296.1 ribosomal protein L1 [Astrosyne radiata]|mmetsp:Transcript_31970/g.73474  ORF Transcript_31970/g.73474 Transcript_31970/m.73474 type:complete len:231 (+) Transcript_31970:544-1236(+)